MYRSVQIQAFKSWCAHDDNPSPKRTRTHIIWSWFNMNKYHHHPSFIQDVMIKKTFQNAFNYTYKKPMWTQPTASPSMNEFLAYKMGSVCPWKCPCVLQSLQLHIWCAKLNSRSLVLTRYWVLKADQSFLETTAQYA